MKLLLNFPSLGGNLELLGNNWGKVGEFLAEYGFDGIEYMIKESQPTEDINLPPKDMVKGVHFPFWMSWLLFWRGEWDKLSEQFGSEENALKYFAGRTPDSMVNTYRWCADLARQLEADYLVIHADHVYLEEAFTFRFVQQDIDVLKAAAEFANAALNGAETNIEVLFENSWWPGLRFNDASTTREFLGLLNQPRKGFVLDTGHLMNSNPDLTDEAEALEFIEETLEQLGDLVQDIRVVHLQKSLAGQGNLGPRLKALADFRQATTFEQKFNVAYEYALSIDKHHAFCDESVKGIIERIKPDYLTYEFIAHSKDELTDFILSQHKCVGIELPR